MSAPTTIAEQLSSLPVKSPDGSVLALIAVSSQQAGETAITVRLLDTGSAGVVSAGTLPLRGLPDDTSLLLTPAFAADSATLALVLSITVPTNVRNITKAKPGGGTVTVPAATWTSHHALAYFDRSTASFAGPYELSDDPSLARVSAVADARDLFLWTVAEASATRAGKSAKGSPGQAPVTRFSAFPLGKGTARFSLPAPGPWPVSGEPVVALPTGDLARLAYGRQVEIYSALTGQARQVNIAALGLPSARPGIPSMQLRPDGTVFIANPAIGRAVITDPAESFKTVSVLSYPPPATAGGAPASKAVLSSDAKTMFVLGPARIGGVSAYDVATGKLVASYAHGEQYTGIYQLASAAVLAISSASPRLTFLTPSLEPFSTADTELQVAAVF